MLVAPWYRWPRQGVPPRETRPVLQKYDVADPLKPFRADPQRSLRFTDDDLVHSIVKAPALPALPAPLQTLQRRLSPLASVPTETRKLFLDTHKRSYLVVAELHADDPGFPCVDRREVCEAGFVIRQRRLSYPLDAEPEVRGILEDFGRAAYQLDRARKMGSNVKMAILRDVELAGGAQPVEHAAALRQGDVQAARQRLVEWAIRVGVERLELGWIPSGTERVGSWETVAAEPQELTEATVRMYPLVPADANETTDGATFYFGLVPTGGSDTTADGRARFDDDTRYEIRCYVRRHDPRCPRTSKPGDCKGELVWSKPTEPYRLAAHFDLTGTSNRPVTVQLPDLRALEAEAASLPMGGGAPFRMKAPEASSIEFDLDPDTLKPKPKAPTAAICSFAIPLITIVATFVFKLFLPVLVIVFQLWFLLKLRFCIPPSLAIGGGGGLDAAIEGSLGVDLDAAVTLGLKNEFDLKFGLGAGVALTSTYSNQVLIDLRSDMAKDMSLPSLVPSYTSGLEYEAPVLRADVRLR
jgi:hypothetical protein